MRKPFVKLLLPVLIILLSFSIVACTGTPEEEGGGNDEIEDVISISVDSSTVPTSAIAGQVDLSAIKLLVLTASDEVVELSLTEDMIATFDKNKLNRPGTHHISVVYAGMTTRFALYIEEAPIQEYTIRIYDGALLGEEPEEDGDDLIWQGDFPKDSRITIRAIDKSGYYFDSWKIDEQVYNRNQSCDITINRNITIRAHYEPLTFSVVFNTNGGTHLPQMETREIEESPVTTKVENVFVEWVESDTGVPVTFPYEVTRNITLNAVWEELGLEFYKAPNDPGYTVVDYTYEGDRTSLTIPDRHGDYDVTTIDKDAFANATNLQSLTLPRYLSHIDEYSFNNCINLLEFNVDSNNEHFSTYNDVLYKGDTLVAYPAGKMAANFDLHLVPGTITKIGTGAFYNANLGSVDISAVITDIGDNAFNSRTIDNVVFHAGVPANLADSQNMFNENINHIFIRQLVYMPDFVEHIAFQTYLNKVKEFRTINIGVYDDTFLYRYISRDVGGAQSQSLEIMGADRSLTEINIPTVNIESRQITSIGKYAFSYCYDLDTVILPQQSQVDRILEGAFDNTKWQLEPEHNHIKDDMIIMNGILFRALEDRADYVVPYNVNKIGEESFSGMSNLRNVEFATDNNEQRHIASIEANAFKDCKNLESIIIPYTVTRIGRNAFENTKLTNFEIEQTTERMSNLETIEDFAFKDAIELKEISLGNYVEEIGTGVFNGCLSLEAIKINQSSNTENNYFIVKDGVLFQKNMNLVDDVDNFGKILHTYPAGKIADVYELPVYGNDGVTHILEYAFYYSNVAAIKIPSTVENISENAIIVPQLVYIEFASEIPVQTYGRLLPEYDPEYVILNENDDSDYNTFGFPENVEVKYSDEFDTTYLLGIVENDEGDKFVYRNDENGVYIVAAERAKASLITPYNVEIDSQIHNIIGLESYAYYGNILKELTIPYTITKIKAYALYYCTDLRRLTSYNNTPPTLEYLAETELPEELVSFHPDIFIENLLIFVSEGKQESYETAWPTHIDYIIVVGEYPQVVFEENGGTPAVVIDPSTGDEMDVTQGYDIPYLPRTQRTGYEFVGWYDDENFEGEMISFPYEKYRNIVFYARWTVQTFDIVYFLSGGTFEETPQSEVSYGQSYILSVPVRPGYDFLGWYDIEGLQYTDGEGTGSGVGSPEHVANNTWGIIQDEVELIAHWEEAEYLVTYDTNGGEVTDELGDPVTGMEVSFNQTFTLDVPEREGYDFIGWRDNDNSPITDSLGKGIGVWSFYEDKTVIAHWRALTYTVKLNDGFDGYYDDITVTYGSPFAFPVPQREDSVFFGWYDGQDGTGTQYTDQFGQSVRDWDKVHETGGHITLYAQWPIDISTVGDFDTIRNNPEGSYILTNDILINIPWVPIGTDNNSPFTGILDGNGYSITNLQISDQHNGYAGLIGYNKGTVRNLNLGVVYEELPEGGGLEPNYDGKAQFDFVGDTELYVGGIAGYNEGLIQNCEIAVTMNIELNANDTDMYVGGIVGYNTGTIEDSEITVEIEAEYAYDVTSEGEKYVGSLVGYHAGQGIISDCYYNRIVMTPDAPSKACGNEDDIETFGSYDATGTTSSPSFW